MDSKKAGTRGGSALSSGGTAPLKPKPGLSGPPAGSSLDIGGNGITGGFLPGENSINFSNPLPDAVIQALAAAMTGNWQSLLNIGLSQAQQNLWNMLPNPMIMDAEAANNGPSCLVGAGPLQVGQSRCGHSANWCTASGIGTMALDIAGFIPGEGLVHSLFGIGLGVVSTPISAAQGNTLGAFGGIAGIHLSALELTGSRAIPWISYPLAITQFVVDYRNIPKDYNKCMGGGD